MDAPVSGWREPGPGQQPAPPRQAGWLAQLRAALERQRQLEDEALRLQIRRRERR